MNDTTTDFSIQLAVHFALFHVYLMIVLVIASAIKLIVEMCHSFFSRQKTLRTISGHLTKTDFGTIENCGHICIDIKDK